jgi:outer membrane protein OmpA-like peptidoglycan-associated protein
VSAAPRAAIVPALFLTLMLVLAGARAAPPAAPAGKPQPAEPDIQAMIEALMPSASRSMRNLVVRQKADGAAVSAASTAAAASPASAVASSAGALAAGSASAVSAGTAPSGAAVPATPAGPPPSLALAIQFEPNSARVRPESGPVLGSLVAAMQSRELKASRFLIEGHADPRGGASQNQRLSQERADEVRLYLVSLGVHPARLRAVGKGASQLADAGDPSAAANRRVRVVTLE